MGGSSSSMAPLKAMESPMAVERFLGHWYVIANIPTPFEKNAYNAEETYTRAPAGATHEIDVHFTYRKGAFDGKPTEMRQKGWIENKTTGTEWRVAPLLAGFTIPYKLPYIICDLTEADPPSEQYATTIIGYPDRSYLWIMAREPELPEDKYAAHLAKVKEMGYDLDKVQKVPQQTMDERSRSSGGGNTAPDL